MDRSSAPASLACPWEGCERTFGKREHLRRHQRSHAKDSYHECPTCGKQFVRRDVMTRHAALHKDTRRKPRKVSCVECVRLKVRCDGQPGETCSRCRNRARSCRYRSQVDSLDLDQTRNLSPRRVASPTDLSEEVLDFDSEFMPSGQSDLQFSPANQSTQPTQPSIVCPGNLSDTSYLPPEILYNFNADPSESFFGWDAIEPDSEDLTSFDMPSFDLLLGDGQVTHASTPGSPSGVESSRLSATHTIRDGQPPDTPWPHVYRPSEKDGQIHLVLADVRTTSIIQQSDLYHVDGASRKAIITMLNNHQSHRSVVDSASFPSAQTLSTCINFYFRHFHTTFPIVRRIDKQTTQESPILLLAMAAIGAMYARGTLRDLAVPLNKLARRAISTVQESNSAAVFEISFVQASLLQSLFGLFCGSRMLYQHAEISRATLVTAARRMHLLRPGLSFVHELQKRAKSPTREELEKAEADDNERRILGWGIYLYDIQISALLNIPSTFGITEINVALPDDEASRYSKNTEESSQTFCEVLGELTNTGRLRHPLSSFGLSIIAHTLYRLCSSAAATDVICSTSSVSADSRYRLAFSANFRHNPQELLDQLAASCHVSRTAPNSLLSSVDILSHLGHIQFTWPGFLNYVKVAAGKSGTEESKLVAREWIAARIASDPAGARFILSHAAQLAAILARYPFDTPSETVLVFDVALTFWALLKFSTDPGSMIADDRISVCTESNIRVANDQAGQTWSTYFEGFGDPNKLTSTKALAIFRQRMDFLSWGLKDQFKQVLRNLELEEASG